MKNLLFVFILFCLGFIGYSLIGSKDNNKIKTHAKHGFAVVQLFTSQGCSSCPRADRLLEEVKQDYAGQNVFVLSYHVDYWNRLGWKDPYSSEAFTKKQYLYGQKFGEGRVYTPQAVINGSLHFVGSSKDKMKTNLSRFLNGKTENLVVLSKINSENDFVSFNYSVEGDTSHKNLNLALTIDKRSTYVKRGENGGRTIENSNIVVEEIYIPLINSEGVAKIAVPTMVEDSDELSVIAYVQDSDLKILGATSAKIN